MKMHKAASPALFEVQEADMAPIDCPSAMDYGWRVVVEYEDYEKLKAEMEVAKTSQKLAEIRLEIERSEWAKERRGLCQAVTRAQKERDKLQHLKLVNDELRQMLVDKGMNADFLFRAKAAVRKLALIRGLYDETSDDEYGKTLLDQVAEVLDEPE